MKYQILVAGAACLFATSASLADEARISSKGDFGAYPLPSWHGPYIGAAIGFGEGSTDYYLDQDGHGADSNEASGLAGSITAGYNWQRASGLVFGVEADVGFIDAAEEHPWKDGHSFQSDYGTWATLRARIGYAHNKFLFFATGGLAYLEVDEVMLGANGGQNAGQTSHNDDAHLGWVIGAGLEYAYSERVNLKLDYLHMEFDEYKATTSADLHYMFENELDIVRVGFNYKLN
ncbi:MAG: outer membrane beta-barrel protein [Hyphomicrobiales bacterium]|nr:outer membrane beta-barrel protein [Hyphomicrobiales bacterium]